MFRLHQSTLQTMRMEDDFFLQFFFHNLFTFTTFFTRDIFGKIVSIVGMARVNVCIEVI